jgi:hypothetical protein
MQEQDFVFRQAQTYTKLLLPCAWLGVAVGGGFCEPPGDGIQANINNKTKSAAVDLV